VKKLFGTDGIRGRDGEYPLDRPTVTKIGFAIAKKMSEQIENPKVIIGRDTRESGTWIDEAIAQGIVSAGATAVHCGIMTTPGLSYLTKREEFDAGVMISASHNPYHDNGIKIFSGNGMKLADETEIEIEKIILSHQGASEHRPFARHEVDGVRLKEDYIDFLCGVVQDSSFFRKLRIVIDCANGSASSLAPDVFRRLGDRALFIHSSPDGRNINLNCGSLHMESLISTVTEEQADLGIAFDGDADRALFIDRNGNLIDGDHTMYAAALKLRKEKKLRNDTVAGTVMSNMWLEKKLASHGISFIRANVGDKYVLEKMLEHGLTLGGEQSGHIIFLDHAPSGDGILTSLKFIESTFGMGVDPVDALSGIIPFPQLLINIRVSSRPDLSKHAAISQTIRDVEQKLSGNGRVLIRYSGTEPLARVMVEAEKEEDVRKFAHLIADEISKHIGA